MVVYILYVEVRVGVTTVCKLHAECVFANEAHAFIDEVEAVKARGAGAPADVRARGRDIVENDGLVAGWGGSEWAKGGALDHRVPHRVAKTIHVIAGAGDVIVEAHMVAGDARRPAEGDLIEANIVHKVHIEEKLHARLLELNHARNHPAADAIPLKNNAGEGAVFEVDIGWRRGVILIVIGLSRDIVVEVVEELAALDRGHPRVPPDVVGGVVEIHCVAFGVAYNRRHIVQTELRTRVRQRVVVVGECPNDPLNAAPQIEQMTVALHVRVENGDDAVVQTRSVDAKA